jgi:hypothetical protein
MSAPGASAGTAGGNGNGSDAGGDVARQGAQEAQQNGQGQPDFSALSQQLEQLAGSQEEMRQFLASNPWQGQSEGGGDAGAEGDDFGDGDLEGFADDEFGDPTEAIAGEMADAFLGVTEQAVAPVAQALSETRQELNDFRQAVDYERLAHELPELADPEVAEDAISYAHQIAQALGVPQLGSNPQMVRLVYLAHRALQTAQEEGAEPAPDPAHVEGGGGAVAGKSSGSAADQIMSPPGKRGASVLPFNS